MNDWLLRVQNFNRRNQKTKQKATLARRAGLESLLLEFPRSLFPATVGLASGSSCVSGRTQSALCRARCLCAPRPCLRLFLPDFIVSDASACLPLACFSLSSPLSVCGGQCARSERPNPHGVREHGTRNRKSPKPLTAKRMRPIA